MADVFQETIDLAELLIIGFVAYLIYEAYSSIQKAGSTKCDPNTLIGKFLCSGGESQPSSVPGQQTVSQSIGGYEGFGSDGQYYSCSGGSNNMCTPMNCDNSGNCTLTGSPVPAAQVGLTSNNPPTSMPTPTPTPTPASDTVPCLGSLCIDPNTTDINTNTMPF